MNYKKELDKEDRERLQKSMKDNNLSRFDLFIDPYTHEVTRVAEYKEVKNSLNEKIVDKTP